MDWVQDMTARWIRIMSAAGGGGTPLDEAVRQINAIADTPAKKGGLGWRRRKSAPASTSASGDDPAAVTVLCRQLIAGVLVSDIAITRLCMLEGRTREHLGRFDPVRRLGLLSAVCRLPSAVTGG
jgi:hypothetical protein